MRTTNDIAVSAKPVGALPNIKSHVAAMSDEEIVREYQKFEKRHDLDTISPANPSGSPSEALQYRALIRARYQELNIEQLDELRAEARATAKQK